MATRVETIGDCTLYLGDCLEILPTLGKVDAVVTDPPYGVGIGYSEEWTDDELLLDNVVIPAIKLSITKAQRCALTPGNKYAWKYPKPDDFGSWFNPAGTGFSPWGFQLSHLIIYYGKCVNRNSGNSTWGNFGGDKATEHPVCKPLQFGEWLVNKASLCTETVLDPFMGSGTTGVACVNLGRKFIGIEIEPKYFDIACKRISDAWASRPRLFEEEKKEMVQGVLI